MTGNVEGQPSIIPLQSNMESPAACKSMPVQSRGFLNLLCPACSCCWAELVALSCTAPALHLCKGVSDEEAKRYCISAESVQLAQSTC